ncbi:unnamed protein product, partial [Cuscuta europaea]
MQTQEEKSGGGQNTSSQEENRTRKREEERCDEEEDGGDQIPSMALNHVTRLCRCVKESVEFYTKVLGLVEMERPPAFEFDGAWLFNYGVGIHLVQANDNKDGLPNHRTDHRQLDPMDNHISFQFEYKPIEATTQEMEIPQLALLFQNFNRERWQFNNGMDCSEEIEMKDNNKDVDCNEKQTEMGSATVDKKKSRSQKGVALKNVTSGSKKLKKQCTKGKKDDDEDESLVTSLVKKTDTMMADMARIKNIQREHGSLLRRILTRLEGKRVVTDEVKEVSEGEKQCLFEKDEVVLHDATNEKEKCDEGGNIEIEENGTEKDVIGKMDAEKGNDKQTELEVDDVGELLQNDENQRSNEKEAMAEEDSEKENIEVSENAIDSQRPSFNIFGFSSQEQHGKPTDEEGL